MRFDRLALMVLAAALMAAAPPQDEAGNKASVWGRFVEGSKRLLHAPFARRDPPPAAEATRGDPRDLAVRQAAAVEQPFAAARDKRLPGDTRRPMVFSRSKRSARTLSQYMAEEKP